MWQKIKNFTLCALLFTALTLLLLNPKTVNSGVSSGLIICAEVIIPSLFVFSVIGILIVSSNCLSSLDKIFSPFSKLLFGLSGKLFIVFLVSLFAGYPVGAKLIDNLVKSNEIEEKTANTMLCYCVNAGPAFVVLAVGDKVFLSKKLGVILLLANIFTSLILAIVLKNKIIGENQISAIKKTNLADAFVNSVADAAQSIINICAFVILFSVFGEALSKFDLKLFAPFFEITTGIIATKNLYFSAFLLGFSGISIQLQVLSVAKSFKVEKLKFFLFRILHGGLSVVFAYILIKILKLTLPVLSNNQSFIISSSSLSLGASICFVCSSVVLIASIKSKKAQLKN